MANEMTREDAKEIVGKLLSRVYNKNLNGEDEIPWDEIFKGEMTQQGECHALLNNIARDYMNEYITTHMTLDDWNEHLENLEKSNGAKRETVAAFIDFVLEVMG
jgi:hypothetical protein